MHYITFQFLITFPELTAVIWISTWNWTYNRQF